MVVFTASDSSLGITAGGVVSPSSIMVHHGFRSKEAMRAQKRISIAPNNVTPHSWLLAKVSRKPNQAFPLVDSFNFNFIVEDRSNIYIYI